MDLGAGKGGLPPDSIVEDTDAILTQTEDAIRRWHDPRPGAMVRVAVAPCSPFSATPRLMRESAALARRAGVRLHTHIAETVDEEDYCRRIFGRRPLQLLDDLEWLGPDVWLAHCVHLNGDDIRRVAQTGTAVAWCPTSNLRLGSGIAPVGELLEAGAAVGLAVDGSASNDAGHMLAEVRQAMLLARARGNLKRMSARDALRIATRGSARCLGRDDVGALLPGKRGVHAVLVASDVPGRKTYGLEIPDQPVLAIDRVRYQGEAVAVLAANDLELARPAAGRLTVAHEVLPALADMEQALRSDAPNVPDFGNVLRP